MLKKETRDNIHISELITALPRRETEHMRRVGILTRLLNERAYVSSLYKAYVGWNDRRHFEQAAFDHDTACLELQENAGIQFDMLRADVFLNNEAAFAKLKTCHCRSPDSLY